MSAGAGMLFLFRVERVRMAFRHTTTSSSSSSSSSSAQSFSGPQQGRPGPDTQTGRAHGGFRQGVQEAQVPRLYPLLCLF